MQNKACKNRDVDVANKQWQPMRPAFRIRLPTKFSDASGVAFFIPLEIHAFTCYWRKVTELEKLHSSWLERERETVT